MERRCSFWFVRHGETQWNIEDKIQGHTDSPLTDLGLKQAQDLVEQLRGRDFKKVYTSDLPRAKTTAEIFAKELGLELEETEFLRERNFGPYEGTSKENLSLLETLEEKGQDFGDVGVEINKSIVERFTAFLKEKVAMHPGESILVVTHGGVMRIMLLRLKFLNREQLQPSAIGNGAVIKLAVSGDQINVEEVIDVNISG